MSDLFGIPTSTIAVVLTCLFGLSLLAVGISALSNRTMFRMGMRNLPRRGSQTILVVVGLMLSTLIVTAAFVTGDTIDYSLTNDSYETFNRSDLDIAINERAGIEGDYGGVLLGETTYVPDSAIAALEEQFGVAGGADGDPAIEAFRPVLWEQAPVVNVRNGIAVATVQLSGVDPERMDRTGGLQASGGGSALISELGADEVYLTSRAVEDLDARVGDQLEIHIGATMRTVTVAGLVADEIAAGVIGLQYANVPPGIAMRLDSLQDWSGHEGEINTILVTIKGGVRESLDSADDAAARIEAYLATDEGRAALPVGDRQLEVETAKKDAIEQGEMNGNLFTTFFLVLGLFSMASGMMLIFMIFVMLAAERRAEMGMARAVGAQRKHLLQSFLAEGMTYSLLAGMVGAALGVGASIGLTLGLMKLVGGEYFELVEFHVTYKSLIIGYTLGVVLTFLTVLVSANKVTRVNIVAAIRSLPDDSRREGRRKTSWRWVIAGVPSLVVPPLGIWFLFRKGLGLPWVWIVAPLGIVAGALFMLLGKSSEVLFPFALGISLLPLCTAAIARYFRAPSRPIWTLVGASLLAYWLLPSKQHDALFGEFDSDIEMFVLSGIMIVVGTTLMIVFNGNILTRLFTRSSSGAGAYGATATLFTMAAGFAVAGIVLGDSGDGLGQLSFLATGLLVPAGVLALIAAKAPGMTPSFKMAVAYPLANRFRTGMTIAMFSLIVFSLTVFSVLIANFSATTSGDDARGRLDAFTTSTHADPVDVPAALNEADSPVLGSIEGSGRTSLATGGQQVRMLGDDEWKSFPVIAADNDYFQSLQPTLDARAYGYETDGEVLEAVRTTPGLAILDRWTLLSGWSSLDFRVAGVEIDDNNGFAPFQIEVRNPVSGEVTTLTVIGGLKANLDAQLVGGAYVNAATYRPLFGEPVYQRTYFRFADGVDLEESTSQIESELALRGVSAESTKELLDNAEAQNVTFNRMFQAFMALGLVVGIAGLGVIAFRSVVERRQQIGMLRAIGFQRGTVAMAFLLESSFIAIMGIGSGVVGGAIIARNLMTSPDFTEGANVTFGLPWVEIAGMVIASYACSLLMTWLPSRGAARVPVADALRYE